jgi:hypothetical protein
MLHVYIMNQATHSPNNLSVFLLGAILNILAAVDYTSLLDYSLKAVAGGLIWLVFKVVGEILAERVKRKYGKKEEEK